jgi:hypothetical protein
MLNLIRDASAQFLLALVRQQRVQIPVPLPK